MDKSVESRFDPCHTLAEWLAGAPDELEIDLISMQAIIGVPRRSFGLHDAEVEEAAREYLGGILARGGRPFQGHNDGDGGYYTRVTRFGDDPVGIVEGVIKEWREAGVDPDLCGIWFALPELIAWQVRDP